MQNIGECKACTLVCFNNDRSFPHLCSRGYIPYTDRAHTRGVLHKIGPVWTYVMRSPTVHHPAVFCNGIQAHRDVIIIHFLNRGSGFDENMSICSLTTRTCFHMITSHG